MGTKKRYCFTKGSKYKFKRQIIDVQRSLYFAQENVAQNLGYNIQHAIRLYYNKYIISP